MARTPDRFPGEREDEGLFLDPDTVSPTVNGTVRYITGTGFQFRDEGVTKGLHLQNTDTGTSSNTFSVGNGSAGDKYLYFNNGDATLPSLLWDESEDAFSFSHPISVNGSRFWGTSATDPSSPTPTDGDMYYNTVLREMMQYDGGRSKWLSIASLTFNSGRNNNTLAGNFYRGINGITFGTNIGYPVPKGTLTGISWTRTDSDAATLEVVLDTTVIATLASGVAGPVYNWSVNADFDEGLLKFRNLSTGNTTTNVQITAIVKRRV